MLLPCWAPAGPWARHREAMRLPGQPSPRPGHPPALRPDDKCLPSSDYKQRSCRLQELWPGGRGSAGSCEGSGFLRSGDLTAPLLFLEGQKDQIYRGHKKSSEHLAASSPWFEGKLGRWGLRWAGLRGVGAGQLPESPFPRLLHPPGAQGGCCCGRGCGREVPPPPFPTALAR